MRENEAVISSWYFLSHRAAGNRRPRSLSLKVQKSAREIWSDALGKIWCKQAQELQIQIVRAVNTKYNRTNTKHMRTNTKHKRTNTKRKRAKKTQRGKEIPFGRIIYGLEKKIPDKRSPLVVVLTIFLQILEEVI